MDGSANCSMTTRHYNTFWPPLFPDNVTAIALLLIHTTIRIIATDLRNMTLCRWVSDSRRFDCTQYLHLQRPLDPRRWRHYDPSQRLKPLTQRQCDIPEDLIRRHQQRAHLKSCFILQSSASLQDTQRMHINQHRLLFSNFRHAMLFTPLCVADFLLADSSQMLRLHRENAVRKCGLDVREADVWLESG